jgi:hypothetical protein
MRWCQSSFQACLDGRVFISRVRKGHRMRAAADPDGLLIVGERRRSAPGNARRRAFRTIADSRYLQATWPVAALLTAQVAFRSAVQL